MGSMVSRKLAGISIVMLIALLAVRLDGLKHAADECSAGKPYCYDAPVHLDSPINTPGFEGKPALSADGLELYFVSDRPGALGGPGDQDIYVTRRSVRQQRLGRAGARTASRFEHLLRHHADRSRSTGLRCTLAPTALVRSARHGRISGCRTVRPSTTRGARR